MSDKMREEFEVEYMSVNHPHVSFSDAGNIAALALSDDGSYSNPTTSLSFFWFCRSRAALCVELPSIGVLHHTTTYCAPDVRSALDAAGVRYK